LSPPYVAAAGSLLAVPTPVVSVAITPELFTRLVSETLLPVQPYPKIPFWVVGAVGSKAETISDAGVQPTVAPE